MRGHQLVQNELLHSFDLAAGPLIRTRLVRLAEQEHLLLISMHQAIRDGWSLGVLASELAALYDAFWSGAESSLAPLPIQYADFAFWQRRWRSYPDIDGTARLLARAASRSIARDEARQWSSETKNR